MQREIVHSSDPQDPLIRVPATDPVHQRSADGAEVILHGVTRGDSLALREFGQLVLATDVFDLRCLDDEVRSEH